MDPILQQLREIGCEVELTGSRAICDPPPTDTDQDWLVLTMASEADVRLVVNKLGEAGFHWEGSQHYQQVAASDFMSWRKGDLNLIVTANLTFAERHRAATSVCKRLNLLAKDDRVAVFQAVLYGRIWSGANG